MRERIRELEAAIAALKASAEAERIAAYDSGVGRFIGAAKAALWVVAGGMAGGLGVLLARFSDGWLQSATVFVASSCVIYALWRVYRGLCFAPKASAIVISSLTDELVTAERAIGFVDFFRNRFSRKA